MVETWLRTLPFALLLTSCSSDGTSTREERDAGSARDASAPRRDARVAESDEQEAPDEDPEDEVVAEEMPPDAGRLRDAAQDAGGDAAAAQQEVHPRCVPRDAGMPGYTPAGPPEGFFPDDLIATHDGLIVTTAGVVARIPGRGKVFGRMEGGSCIVTVAESGASTTILGAGDVCIHGQLVASMGRCLVDANGDPVP